MICPKCGGKIYVQSTVNNDTMVARRKKCQQCKSCFYTLEQFTPDARYNYNKILNKYNQKGE